MREVEFLPSWYPRMRQRKRWLAIQAWMTLIISATLGLWLLMAQRNVRAKERQLSDISTALEKSQSEVQWLDELLNEKKMLDRKSQIFDKIGRPIDSTRLLTTLSEMMPKDMAILDLTAETQEPKPATIAAKSAADRGNPARILNVKVQGVAPTDADLANFLAKLTATPLFCNVALGYSRQRTDNGHIMREFEVNFGIDLSALGGS